MKNVTKNLIRLLFILLNMSAVVFYSCSKEDDTDKDTAGTIAVTNISLDVPALTLNIGEDYTLTATITPDNAADKTITWTSSNTSAATVADGKVTAKTAGTTTITAKAGDKTATCTVTVTTAREKKYLPSTISLIDTYSTDGGSYSVTYLYTYNDKNQITKIKDNYLEFIFEYAADNLSTQKQYSGTNLDKEITYTYSTGSVQAKESIYFNGSVNSITKNTYTINNMGAATRSSYWPTNYTYDESNNLVKIKDLVTNNTLEYNNKKGSFSGVNMPLWFQFEMPVSTALGIKHCFVNSIVKCTIDDQNRIEGTFTVENTYNSDGYPSKMEYSQNGKVAFTYTITYIEAK